MKGLVCPLDEEMTDKWIEEFLYPEKTLEGSGRLPLDFDYIHDELAKPNVTLSLLHHEYEAKCQPTVKSIQTILKSNKKSDAEQEMKRKTETSENNFGFTRGSNYYGGTDK